MAPSLVRSRRSSHALRVAALAAAVWLTALPLSAQAGSLPAEAHAAGTSYRLGNAAVVGELSWETGHLGAVRVRDAVSGSVRDLGPVFSLQVGAGPAVAAGKLKWAAPPRLESLAPLHSTRLAEQTAGKQLCADASVTPQLSAHWCLLLRDGSPYLRETLTLHAHGGAVPLREVTLIDLHDEKAHVSGTVAGSPLVDDRAFFAFEHPLAHASAQAGRATASVRRFLPLQPGADVTYSSVVGFAPQGQMRRTFLSYLERERIHPYRPFLTYNSWYDLGTGERYDEAGALNRVHAFGDQLVKKRGVTLNSYLFDDGWDDPSSFWQFNAGFPHGVSAVGNAAKAYGAGVGIWLSPWGGYDKAKLARIAYGRAHGYEIIRDGYALSGPRYFKAFEQIGSKLIAEYGINQFKIDGTGNADQVFPGSVFDSDFDAAIHLLTAWRKQKPDLFLNLTTGTYPSPFWLMYADSIWRGGEDHSFAGVGSWRQKWITYRDGQTYKNIVRPGPLFPLNSLMLHSIIYGRGAEHLGALDRVTPADDADFADEVWTFFGSGTDLQELYVTPSLLNGSNWDELAAGARWSRANKETLRDTHWVGGDPAALQPYGWASWTAGKAILVLRNPSDRAQTLSLDAQTAFELPPGSPRHLHLVSVRPETPKAELEMSAGSPVAVTLAPFEVRVFETAP